MARFDGKVVLITGGTTGIGAATARLFRQEGAKVIVTGSNPATLEAAREALPGVEVVAADAADTGASKTVVAQVMQRHGRLDVLFVNAGIAKFAPLDAVDEAFFDAHFGINVRGAFFVAKHAAAVMADGGAIVLTASISQSQGMPGMSVYAASKAALRSFGRTLASELAPRRIRVNTVSPGPIETPIFGKVGLPPEQLEAMSKDFAAKIPLKRFGRPEEIAEAVLFLASEQSSFTTGAELVIDGGMLEAEVADA